MTLIDANIFCAYWNDKDVHHGKAMDIIENLIYGKTDEDLIVTDHIFDETVNVLMRKVGKTNAIKVGNVIMNSEIFLACAGDDIFQKAWNMFQQTEKFSFTDCATITFMETNGVNRIATFDKEFKKIKWIEVID